MTKVDLAQQLMTDIRTGVWQPGQVLTQQQLAAYYQLSRIPVRDAMQQLMEQGWLVRHGKVGCQVMSLTAAQAMELALIRAELEPLALRQAFAQLTQAHLGQAKDVLLQLQSAERQSSERVGQLNWQFHCCLYQACQQPYLLNLLQQLHDRAALYISFQHRTLGYASVSEHEHRLLLQQLEAGDLSEAEQTLRQHILHAATELASWLATSHQPATAEQSAKREERP